MDFIALNKNLIGFLIGLFWVSNGFYKISSDYIRLHCMLDWILLDSDGVPVQIYRRGVVFANHSFEKNLLHNFLQLRRRENGWSLLLDWTAYSFNHGFTSCSPLTFTFTAMIIFLLGIYLQLNLNFHFIFYFNFHFHELFPSQFHYRFHTDFHFLSCFHSHSHFHFQFHSQLPFHFHRFAIIIFL